MMSVPVDPDAETARQWVLRELSKPEYEAARPSWFDRFAGAVVEWFQSLRFGGVDGPPVFGIVLVVAIIVIAIVVAFLVFGLPKLRQRSAVTGELFGADDTRSAATLRQAAEALAAEGDYTAAIAEMFRSIARGLAERAITSTTPGTTASAFAARASVEFPSYSSELRAAATTFDQVRYLGQPGTLPAFTAVSTLEANLRSATPQLTQPPQSTPVAP